MHGGDSVASKSLYFDIIGRDKSGSAALDKVGTRMVALGAVALAATTVAVKAFADFDQKMSQVQALSHATSAEMDGLSHAALTMGQSIGFSAGQVADAETELVKAGVSVQDILGGGLSGALSLAAAGQIDVAESTQIATTALTQFKLQGKDVPHVADLLAAGADKALGGVDQLGQALQQGGLVAAQFGLTIDDTVGTLSAFANAGLLGSDAGTSMKTMFLALASPSTKAADTMRQLGINAYDAQGKFIGVTALAGQLHDKLLPLADAQRNAALATIFGTDAIRSASILMQQGADGIQDWITSVNDSGFAAEQARAKTNNLNGDLSKLKAVFETDLIQAGSGANDVLRDTTKTITGLAQGFANAPEPVQQTILAIAGVTAGAALLGGGLLILVPKIESTMSALKRLNTQGITTGKILGKGGAGVAAITAITGALAGMTSEATLSAGEMSKLDASFDTHNLKDLNKEFSDAYGNTTTFKGALDQLFTGNFWTSYQGGPAQLNGAIKALTFGMVDLGAYADTNRAKMSALGDRFSELAKTDLDSATRQFRELVTQMGGGKETIRQLLQAFPSYEATLRELAAQQGKNLSQQELYDLAMGKGMLAQVLSESATKDNTAALKDLAGTAQTTKGDIDDLSDTIKGFGRSQFDLNSAQRDFEAALDQLTASVKDNGTSLDISTEKGRANQEALDSIAKSALDVASATLQRTGSEEQARDAVQRGRDALIAQLAQFGITGDAANAYADNLGLIPGNIATAVQLTGTDTAVAQAARVQAEIAKIQRNVDIAIQLHGVENLATTGGLKVARAGGGDLDMAPGPKGVDSMYFKGAKGEHVLTADDVDAMGGQAAVYDFRRRLHGAASRAAGIGVVPNVSAAPALAAAPVAMMAAPVNVRVTQLVGGVSLRDLVRMEIETADGWKALELNSGEGR